jgi:hypothetical protein
MRDGEINARGWFARTRSCDWMMDQGQTNRTKHKEQRTKIRSKNRATGDHDVHAIVV